MRAGKFADAGTWPGPVTPSWPSFNAEAHDMGRPLLKLTLYVAPAVPFGISTSAQTCACADAPRKSTMQRAPTPCASQACSAKSGWALPLLSIPAYKLAEGAVDPTISTMNMRPCGLGTCVLKPDGGRIGKVMNCLPVPGKVEYRSLGVGSTLRFISLATADDSHVGVNLARGRATRPPALSVMSK